MSRARDMASKTFWLPGEVIQTVTVENVSQTLQTATAGSILDLANMAVNITPKKANSKIIIQMRWFGELSPTDSAWNGVFGCSRNGTQIGRVPGITNASGITVPALSYYGGGDVDSTGETGHYYVVDTPGTTSTLTYRVTWLPGNSGSIYTNRVYGNTNVGGYESGTSGIMATEIAQ